MTAAQPDDGAPDLDDTAGFHALRLDTERAREDLEKTLAEIERRLDPQRFLQPVTRTVSRATGALGRAYRDNHVGVVTSAVFTVGAVATVVVWATRSTPSDAGDAARRAVSANPRGARRPKLPVNPALKTAKKTSKRAIKAVVKAHR